MSALSPATISTWRPRRARRRLRRVVRRGRAVSLVSASWADRQSTCCGKWPSGARRTGFSIIPPRAARCQDCWVSPRWPSSCRWPIGRRRDRPGPIRPRSSDGATAPAPFD